MSWKWEPLRFNQIASKHGRRTSLYKCVFDVAVHRNKQIGRVHRQNLLQLFNSPEIL